mgnify:CR=1 FL=1
MIKWYEWLYPYLVWKLYQTQCSNALIIRINNRNYNVKKNTLIFCWCAQLHRASIALSVRRCPNTYLLPAQTRLVKLESVKRRFVSRLQILFIHMQNLHVDIMLYIRHYGHFFSLKEDSICSTVSTTDLFPSFRKPTDTYSHLAFVSAMEMDTISLHSYVKRLWDRHCSVLRETWDLGDLAKGQGACYMFTKCVNLHCPNKTHYFSLEQDQVNAVPPELIKTNYGPRQTFGVVTDCVSTDRCAQ